MCWNATVSTIAGLCHLITAIIVYANPYLNYRKAYLLFLGFYLTMEIFQTIQHLTFETDTCTNWNIFTTIIAYILIWVQPLLFYKIYAIAVKSSHILLKLTMITFIVAMLSLLAGFTSAPTYSLPNNNYGSRTCTRHDINGHLEWIFALKSIQYSPTFYVYLLLIGVISWEFPDELFYTISLGWWGTLLISLIWVGLTPALASVWCVTSFMVDIPILVTTYRQSYNKYMREKLF